MSVSTSTELSGSGDIAVAVVTVLAAVVVGVLVAVEAAEGVVGVKDAGAAERRSLCAPLGVSAAATSASCC